MLFDHCWEHAVSNALYRLTDVAVDLPEVNDETFTYDTVGNRKTEAGVDGEWNYNENNELLIFADVEYVYDDNGNMIQKKVGTAAVNYIYNTADRLVKVEDDLTKTVIAEYYYDPFGRRLWKDVGGTKTYFFYSDEGLIGEYDAMGTEIKTYGYKPGSTWTTDPLFMKQGGEYYFYQNDHLGTPQKLVGVNGAVVWSAQYTAFGEATVDISTVTSNLRFGGQYFDAETRLHYNFHRYYEPRIGRYLRKDPLRLSQLRILIQISLGQFLNLSSDSFYVGFEQLLITSALFQYGLWNPQALNLYPYAQNAPINFIDPTGGTPLITALIGGVIGGVTNGVYAQQKGHSFWKGFGIGFVGGFIGGLIPSPGIGGAITGAIIGYANVKLGIDCGSPVGAAITGGILGGVGGWFTGLAGKGVFARAGKAANSDLSRKVTKSIATTSVSIFAGTIGGIAAPHLLPFIELPWDTGDTKTSSNQALCECVPSVS